MALIEKTHRGNATRVIALLLAAILAAWLVLFLLEDETLHGKQRAVGVLLVGLFGVLGWWRWRLLVDLAVANLPLWIIFPVMTLRVPNFSFVEIALVSAAVGGAIRVAQTGRFRWYATLLTPYMALLVLMAAVSSVLYFIHWFVVVDSVFLRLLFRAIRALPAVASHSNFHTLRELLTLAGGFVFFHVVVARVREVRDVRYLVRLSVLSAVLVSEFGIYQRSMDLFRVSPAYWGDRINAAFPDPNSLGSFLVVNLFMLLPLLRLERGRRPRGLGWLALPILLLGFWWAHSRAAFGALVLVLPLYWLLRSRRAAFERPVVWLYRKRRFLLTVFVLGMITLGFVFLGLDRERHSDLQWTYSTGPVARMLKGRLNIWRNGFYAVAEVPWFGRGIGTYYLFSIGHWEPVEGGGEWNWNPPFENAHNQVLQWLAEMGMLGGGMYLLIVGLGLYQGLRAIAMHSGEDRVWIAAILCGLVAFMVTWMTGHPLVIPDVNLWFWFVTALLFVPCGLESPAFAEQQAQSRGFRRFLLGALLVMAIFRAVEAVEPRPPAAVQYGLHNIEYMDPPFNRYSFFWARKEVALRIYQVYPDITFCLRKPAGLPEPVTVTVRINGETIDRVRLTDWKWRVCSYWRPLTCQTSIKLELLSDKEYKPPNDARRLAVQVQSLIENTWW